MEAKPYLREITILKEKILSYETYPFSIPAIKNFSTMKFHQDVTFIVGENGSGKSTFLEALSQWLGLSVEGGSKRSQRLEAKSTDLMNYLQGTKSYKKPVDFFFLRAESFYNVATYLDEVYAEEKDTFFKSYGINSLHECSHGEAFLAILSHRLGSNGLYLFDEPEAALSPTRLLTALSLINSLVERGSQLIIATHSPILLAYPNAVIYQFDEEGVTEIDYEQSQPFIITKSFINDYKAVTEILMR